MTRMTGPDCAVMCNFLNTHTHTHTAGVWKKRRSQKLVPAIPEKAAPLTGTISRATGPVPKDSRQ